MGQLCLSVFASFISPSIFCLHIQTFQLGGNYCQEWDIFYGWFTLEFYADLKDWEEFPEDMKANGSEEETELGERSEVSKF